MNRPALHDAYGYLSTATLATEAGHADQAAIALHEAGLAALEAFPLESRESDALAVLLGAATDDLKTLSMAAHAAGEDGAR